MNGTIGSQHWRRNLFVCLGGSFTTIVAMTMLLPYLPIYVEHLGADGHAAIVRWSGVAYAATFLTAALTAPLWGRLGDRFGRKPMLVRASLGMAVAMALTGLAQNVEQLVLLRLLTGLLGGYSSGSMILVAAQTPKAHSAWALGVLSIGVMAGSVVGPLVGGVAPELVGVRASFLVAGGVIFVAFLATMFGIREERPRRAEAPDAVADEAAPTHRGDQALSAGEGGDAGATDRDGETTTADRDGAPAPIGRDGRAASPDRSDPVHPIRSTRNPATSGWGADPRRVGILLAVASLLMFATMSLEPIVTVFVRELDPGTSHVATLSGVVMAVGALGSIASAPRLGRLADRIGHGRVITGGLAGAAVLLGLQAATQEVWQLIVLRFGVGFCLGGLMPSVTAAIRHAVPDAVVGRVLGLSVSAQFAGQVLGPVTGGVVAGAFGMRSVFVMTALVLVAGTLVSRVGAPPRPSSPVAAVDAG
ncbi:MFS transporter [Patulibacter minatonensis]|uniref:MFS transporter n=1 Tax=Patulibacter minatonensis TaxID=298163 RepID=UPI00047D04C1|nr:MFS transporter [Patulibacter minatonensis]